MSSPTKHEGPATKVERRPPFQPTPGLIVAEKYRVERVVGEGGMGVVVAATHEGLEQQVAIKFLAPEAIRNAVAVERFLREAKIAAKVKSEHVARVSDVGTVEGGTPFIVMEYLEGSDLAALIQAGDKLPIEEVCEIGLQACEALAEVHAAGIVHRDLKPSNLFVTRRSDGSPCAKLLDFGISKFSSDDEEGVDPALTATHAIMGSPAYMSPEQLKSTKEVDARTDVWSLGVVLYEALTGKAAFRRESVPQVCAMIASEEPAPPSGIRSEIPTALETAILACLVKDPDRRASLVDLARALAGFAPERARASLERVEATLGAERSQKSLPLVRVSASEVVRTQESWGDDKGRKRSGGGRLLLFVLVAGGVLGVGVYTGRIDLRSIAGQVSGGASAVASALPAASSMPPMASVVAPIASFVAPITSAIAPIVSSLPPIPTVFDDSDASDDADSDDEDDDAGPAAAATASGSASPAGAPHVAAAPRPAPAKHAPSHPKHYGPRHKPHH